MKTRNNIFYRDNYYLVIIVMYLVVVAILVLSCVIPYQLSHQPLPEFYAVTKSRKQMQLIASTEPNLLPTTILQWASKAAVAAYTFDFVNYKAQIELARPYFTPGGWADYQASIARLIQSITKNQLFVNGVVVGAPVIANQGDFPGKGYTWRIQIPFLVTYQSTESTSQKKYTVSITIVKISTRINPQGIGIDQFVMT